MQTDSLDQYFLELVNRARINPVAESARMGVALNQGLKAGTIRPVPMQPLAWRETLNKSADLHSKWMLKTGNFGHVGEGGTTFAHRMANAGFAPYGTFFAAENIGWVGSSTVQSAAGIVDEVYKGLFKSSTHRINLLGDFFQETGVGVIQGNLSGANGVIVTQNFAYLGPHRFITGVAYIDRNANNFYTPGEGLAGVSVELVRADGKKITAAAAGGYTLPFTQNGAAQIRFTGGGLTTPAVVSVTTGQLNLKIDLVNRNRVETNTSLTLVSGIQTATLIGAAKANLTGNAGANVLNGNSAANVLNGAAGADIMRGGAGNDTYRVDHAKDRTVEASGAGVDRVISTVTHTLAANVENLTLAGSAPLSGTGNAMANVITGNAGNNFLRGQAGNDRLLGGGGNDRLLGANVTTSGQKEIDTLAGGGGNDTFILGVSGRKLYVGFKNADYAVIQGFSPNQDRLQLTGSAADYLTRNTTVGSLTGVGLFADVNRNGRIDGADDLVGLATGSSYSRAQLVGTAQFV